MEPSRLKLPVFKFNAERDFKVSFHFICTTTKKNVQGHPRSRKLNYSVPSSEMDFYFFFWNHMDKMQKHEALYKSTEGDVQNDKVS